MSDAPQSRSPFIKCMSPVSVVCIDTGSLNEFVLGLAAIMKHFGSHLSHFGSSGGQGDHSFGGSTWIVDSETGGSGSSIVSTEKRLFIVIVVPVVAS